MQFETFVVVRLLRPPGTVALPPEQAADVQDGHLAHIHRMHAAGQLLAAGPAARAGGSGVDDRDDRTLRGVAIMLVDLPTARALWAEDPAVRAGLFAPEFTEWTVPAAMMVAGAGLPPASTAEVRG